MVFRSKRATYGVAAVIIGASIFGGIKVAGQFKTFDSSYWKQEVVEEKDKRIAILDRVSGLGKDGSYSVDDLAMLHDGILASTMLFNYMDTDKGDLKAYDSPISPGDQLMGALNMKYGDRFNTEGILADLRKAHEAGSPVRLAETNLDERVGRTIGEIRATFTDRALNQEDLGDAEFATQYRKAMTGGFGGLALGLLGYTGLLSLYSRRKEKKLPETETIVIR